MKEFPSLVSLLTVASDTETLWLPRTVCVRPGAEPSQGVVPTALQVDRAPRSAHLL